MLKKLIAGALSASLLVSAAVSGNLNSLVTEKNTPSDRTVQKSELSVEGSNSLGKMIGDAYSDQNADNIKPLSASFSEKRFEITDLNFDLDTGIVTVNSTQDMDCELIVSFIDDDNAADTIDIKTPLLKGENVLTELSVDTNRLPEFFNICAVLKDQNGYELSAKHNFNNYTRFKQKINSATVEDFDEEYVVNLDDDDTTNFFVLKEETVIAESSENTNTLVSADYDNDTYVFENIDDSIRNLKEGDCLYVRPNETDIIAVNVDNIRINGNRSEIKGTGNADDIFEFVKLEFDESDIDDVRSEKYNEDKTIKLENAQFSEEGAVLDYEIGDFSDEYKADDMMGILSSAPILADILKDPMKKVPIGINGGIELKKDFYPLGKDENANLVELMSKTEDPLNDNLKIEASIGVKLTVAFKATLNFFMYNDEVEIAIDASLGATLKVGAKAGASYTLDLPAAYFSFYGIVDIGACPELKLEVNAEIYASSSFAVDFSFFYNNSFKEGPQFDGKFYQLATSESAQEVFGSLLGAINNSFVVTGEVSVTFDPCLGIWFVNKNIISGLVGMPITFKIEASESKSNDADKLADLKENSLSNHYCSSCWDINTSVTFGINVKAYLPIVGEVKKDLAEKTYELDKYYYSPNASGKKFGKGECPYRLRPVKIHVEGNDDYPSSGLTVILDDKSDTTDEEGNVSFYAKPCNYEWNEESKNYNKNKINHTYVIKSGEEDLAKGNFTFDADDTTVTVKITKTSKSNTINTNKQITTEPQPVTEPATEAPHTPPESAMGKVADEHKIQYAGKLGENIRYTIYKNGYMVIDGYGEMNKSAALKGADNKLTNFSSAEEKALVKNVVINDSKADLKQLLTDEYVLNLYIIDNAKDLVKAFNDSDKDEKNDIKYFGSLSSENETILKKYINENMKYYSSILDKYKESLLTEAEGQFIANIDDSLFSGCENLETVVLPANIESIDSSAFSGCTNLRSITYEGSPNAGKKAIDLPPSLKSIGDSAFKNCSSLEGELDFTNLVNLNTIEQNAFSGCTGITIVKIPNSLSRIDFWVFYKCDSITDMIIPESIKINNPTVTGSTYKLHNLFSNVTPYVPSSVKKITLSKGDIINKNAFSEFTDLETVVLPATIETIDAYAFRGCKNLKSITYEGSPNAGKKAIDLPPSLKIIGDSAFSGCSSLEGELDLTGNSALEEIGSSAFSGCEGITSVHIPGNVKAIDANVFNGCTNLKEAIIEPGVEIIQSPIFDNCILLEEVSLPFAGFDIEKVNDPDNRKDDSIIRYFGNGDINLKTINILGGKNIPFHMFHHNSSSDSFSSLETINIISDTVVRVEENAFEGCTAKNINFYSPIKTIENGAFLNCSELKTITLPDSLEELGEYSFKGCTLLEKISLPDKITKIPSHCFQNCSSLKSIKFPDSLQELSNEFLFNCTSIESITIPGSVEIIPLTSFRNCQNLKKVILLEGVQQIIGKPNYTQSFYDCDSLSEIYIPKSFTMIGQNSFGVTINDDFGTVYYGGNEEEWEALKATQMKTYFGSELNGNDSIFNANVIFNAKPEDMSSYVASQEEFVPSGDVNGNGKLDLGDALAILQYIANSSKYPLSEEAIKQADVYNTGDGITPMDALAIQQYDAGLIDSLPVYR